MPAGQAQKEVTVNEALVAADALLHAAAEALSDTPPTAPVAGQCWIVGNTPAGAFAGHADALAVWTEGGWRMVAPRDGMRIYDRAKAACRLFRDGVWHLAAVPAAPAGGTVIDAEARGAIATLVALLRESGVFSAS